MKNSGRFLLGVLYAVIPVVGWLALWRSFKQVKANDILALQNVDGTTELIDKEGIYFRPFPGDKFGKTFNKSLDYIDFGAFQRVRVKASQIAYKTNEKGQLIRLEEGVNIINAGASELFNYATNIKDRVEDYIEIGSLKIVRIKNDQIAYKTAADGTMIRLDPGVHEIDLAKGEMFDRATAIKNISENYLDFGAIKIVRIKAGEVGVKTDKHGNFVELKPGIHTIDVRQNETFDATKGIQAVGQDDYFLGYTRYITIRNGYLGESYKNGLFCLLEPGKHTLLPGHNFVKKVSVENDVVDLGAYKIITVKEGQVAVINTQNGVVTKGPGKHEVKQEEGNFFNALITTSPQGVDLPTLIVMCSDKIEMKAEAMLIYKVNEPLKTVALGIDKIIGYLKTYADGTLRNILSRFSSADIAQTLHTDEEHHSAKRSVMLAQVHDDLVKSLDDKAKEWGLCVTDLQITKILPADEEYHKTIRDLGSKQSTAEANQKIAENEAVILGIRAKAEESKVIAAKIEAEEAIIIAQTEAKKIAIKTEAEANQTVAKATAQARAIDLIAAAESNRIRQLSEVTANAPEITQQVMLIEAQGKVLERIKSPVFVQPGLGNTTVLTRENNGLTLFSTKDSGKRNNTARDVIDISLLQKTAASAMSPQSN